MISDLTEYSDALSKSCSPSIDVNDNFLIFCGCISNTESVQEKNTDIFYTQRFVHFSILRVFTSTTHFNTVSLST